MWKLSFRSRSHGGVDVCRNEIVVVEEFYVKKDGGMSQVVVCIGSMMEVMCWFTMLSVK